MLKIKLFQSFYLPILLHVMNILVNLCLEKIFEGIFHLKLLYTEIRIFHFLQLQRHRIRKFISFSFPQNYAPQIKL